MKSTSIMITMLFCAFSLVFSSSLLAESRYGNQKVVYHINYDNPKAQAGALRNIQNHINAVGKDKLEIRVVMHGKGLSLLLDPEAAPKTKLPQGNATDTMQAKISGLKDQGVGFQVCANTLKGKQISVENDLYDVSQADIVPSGVAELAHLQSMGYAYIKP